MHKTCRESIIMNKRLFKANMLSANEASSAANLKKLNREVMEWKRYSKIISKSSKPKLLLIKSINKLNLSRRIKVFFNLIELKIPFSKPILISLILSTATIRIHIYKPVQLIEE